MIKIIADMANAHQYWERRSDELPFLLVPMSDGSVVRYNAEIPHPGFTKAITNIKNMVVGYPAEDKKGEKENG